MHKLNEHVRTLGNAEWQVVGNKGKDEQEVVTTFAVSGVCIVASGCVLRYFCACSVLVVLQYTLS